MFSLPFDLRLDSPVAVAAYPAGATFGPRLLRNWEFVWMLEGDAQYQWNGTAYDAPEGSVVLCRPSPSDFFRWDEQKRTRHAYFHFEVEGTFPAEWPAPSEWPLVRATEPGDLLHTLFRHLLTWHRTGDPVQTQLAALSLFAAFVTGQAASREAESETLPPAVQTALSHIASHMDTSPSTPLSLADLADAACVTPEYLCRIFKKATGHSPSETVRLARLDRSATLLARTNFSVGEIATLCGFESPFHFSRRFKVAFGCGPRELRQRIARGEHIPGSRLLRQPPAPNT